MTNFYRLVKNLSLSGVINVNILCEPFLLVYGICFKISYIDCMMWVHNESLLRQKKKYLCSYLNFLVKPRFFFRFSGKNIFLCILKGYMPFKMHKIIFFSRKKICVPTLPKIFRSVTETYLFFYLA